VVGAVVQVDGSPTRPADRVEATDWWLRLVVELGMEIRPVRTGEGARLRELRLTAIQEAPHAFFWSLQVEQDTTVQQWECWADYPGNDRVMFVAVEGEAWVGMAGCSLRDGDAGSMTLDGTGMWISPAARGRGLGERLIEAIIEWGRARGAGRMEFAVTETNEVAIALYQRLGFRPTGRRRALESYPELTGMFMAKSLHEN
jgi:ribosomal protein S18 acetylase RimI-like enzyme